VLTDYRAMFAGLFQRMFGLETASLQRIFAGVHAAEVWGWFSKATVYACE